eukprot:g10.t1
MTSAHQSLPSLGDAAIYVTIVVAGLATVLKLNPGWKPDKSRNGTYRGWGTKNKMDIFGAALGPWLGVILTAVMIICPATAILIQYTQVELDGSLNAMLALVWNFAIDFKGNPVATVQSAFAWTLDKYADQIVPATYLTIKWWILQAVLMIFLPGNRHEGPTTENGHVPVYKENGLLAYFVCVVGLPIAHVLGWIDLAEPYDIFGGLTVVLNVYAIALTIFLWIKGHVNPSGPDSGSLGSVPVDLFWGMELYPRVFGFDLKMFTNCRFGLMAWTMLPISYCFKQYAEYQMCTPALLASTGIQVVYMFKFYLWEMGYMHTMDIQHDRFGYYEGWGCSVWVPVIYTSHSLYFVDHAHDVSREIAAAIFILGVYSVFVNYEADWQRQVVRQNDAKLKRSQISLFNNLIGRDAGDSSEAVRVIRARYTFRDNATGKSQVKKSILVVDGWWSVVRHFHYIPELTAQCSILFEELLSLGDFSISEDLIHAYGVMPGKSGRHTSAGQFVEPNYAGVGMLTDVKGNFRPVTREGLGGIRVQTAGMGRRIQDSSFYLGLLRSKNAELSTEIDTIKREIEQSEKDSSKYSRLEVRYESLMKEVRDLEGTLADYNLSMDKARTSTNPEEIERFKQGLQDRNKATEREVDAIFVSRQKEEGKFRAMQKQIMGIHKSTDERIAQLAPDKLQKYKTLMSEDFALAREVERKSQTIHEMKRSVARYEDQIRKNTWRNEYLSAERQLSKSKKDLAMLEQEYESLSMDPATAREHLLEKVRWTSNAIKEADAKIEELEEANEKSERMLQELTADINNREGKSRDSKKYEVLFQRDKEMTQFIENFPGMSRQQVEDQEKTRQMIVALLEHMSGDIKRRTNIPTKESVEDMRDDLSFKKRQVDASQSTQKRLEKELLKRSEELKKIDKVGEKIQNELSSLTEQMKQMRDSMEDLEDIGKLKQEALQTADKLRDLVKIYESRRDSVRQQLPLLTSEHEKIKQSLECETMGNLNAQEVRIRVNEQSIFKLTDFLKTKSRETQYATLKEKCSKTLQKINTMIVRIQNEFEQSVIGGPGAGYI